MNFMIAMKLMEKHMTCPDCGNGSLGNGEGTLAIEDKLFKRTCKCGWKIEIHEKDLKAT